MNHLNDFLIPSIMIFATGLVGVLIKKNLICIFMCVEIMICSAMLAIVSFSSAYGNLNGAVFAFFVMAIAACEVALALEVITQFFKIRRSISADDVDTLGD